MRKSYGGFHFESEAALAREENQDPLNEDEMKVFRQAKKAENDRPQLTQWLDVYPAKVAQADIKEMDEMKRRRLGPEVERTARSLIAEYGLATEIYEYSWLGKDCNTYRTSEHDDIVNHTDMVLEWKEADGPVRLLVDVTTSQSTPTYLDKKADIKQGLDSNHLGRVKRFESAYETTEDGKSLRGQIDGVPKVVLALSRDQVKLLCDYMANTDDEEKQKKRENNPLAMVMVEEIKYQMMDQINYELGLIFEEINNKYFKLNSADKQQLAGLLEKFNALGDDPAKMVDLIDTLAGASFAGHSRFLVGQVETAKKLKQVLEISLRLGKEKSDLLGQEAVKQVAAWNENNVVLRQPQSKTEVPAELLDRLDLAV